MKNSPTVQDNSMESNRQWHVVIIDDEPDIRDVVSIVLEDAGFIVHTAENGQQGIDLCRGLCPQIVLTDIRMPGIDGIQVLEQLKNLVEDIEVIVITAFGDLELAIRALQLDASDFITKPVNETALQLAMQRAMERYDSRRKLKEYTAFLEQENISQAKLLHKDKLVSLGRLCASVVHEINNPLTGILNYARLMIRILKSGELTPEHIGKFSRYLNLVESESSRISEITSSLLTFSRKSDPVVSDIHVDELIHKSALLCRHRLEMSGIQLVIDCRQGLPMIKGDFSQLQQCLINLIFNSADAMPLGGRLTLAGFTGETGDVTISVTDTGCGIPEEIMKKIFEPFFTTKQEGHGVGLGLSIIFGIMERHGGHVDVQSIEGKGSCFSLILPVPDQGQD